jgi:hypothetical protein
MFMHTVNFGYAPKSFAGIWQKNSERPDTHNLRNENHFILPAPRIDLFKRLPLYALPLEWNSVGHLIHYENRFTFKMANKEQLFNEIANENNL